jgi:hypothetical protein
MRNAVADVYLTKYARERQDLDKAARFSRKLSGAAAPGTSLTRNTALQAIVRGVGARGLRNAKQRAILADGCVRGVGARGLTYAEYGVTSYRARGAKAFRLSYIRRRIKMYGTRYRYCAA